MNNWPAILVLLTYFFKDDESKIAMWLNIENPMLGDIAPINMIISGRSQKLLDFIKNQLLGIHP